jgi:hypothetical protein
MTMHRKGKKEIAIGLPSRSDPKRGSVGNCPGNFSFGSRRLLTNLKVEVIGN